MVLTELLLGRVAPSALASDEKVKREGLQAINAYRYRHGYPRLRSLPQACPGLGYDVCLLGACVSDMPDRIGHAERLAAIPKVSRLEIRFERRQLPELISDYSRFNLHPRLDLEPTPTAHDHYLAR